MKPYTTRIAPSPTGFIHLGNVRTAYHNYLAARNSNGKFILRIDDTDKERSKTEYVDKIYETFDWMKLSYDETFKQSQTDARNIEIAHCLVKNDLAEVIDGGAIRLKNIPHIPDVWKDNIAGEIKISNKDKEVLQNIIIVRSDGSPTYNFSSIIDDMFSGVNLIIRGTDHISNTVKQLTVLHSVGAIPGNPFNVDVPDYINNLEFAHVGLVFEKGKKLSKRDGSSNLDNHRANGILPDAMLNWILRFGWSPKDAEFDKKHAIIPKEFAEQIFLTEGSMKNSSSSLDLNKLAFLNKKYNTKK